MILELAGPSIRQLKNFETYSYSAVMHSGAGNLLLKLINSSHISGLHQWTTAAAAGQFEPAGRVIIVAWAICRGTELLEKVKLVKETRINRYSA